MGTRRGDSGRPRLHKQSVSEHELRVILAMRQSGRHGDAIYRYAMSFDSYDNPETGNEPYTG